MRSGIRTQFSPRTPWRLLRGAALCLALAASAGPAFAGRFYVSPSGNDANAGTSSGAPWRTLTKANSTLLAGDVVNIAPGTYTDQINPTHNGTSITQRISYVGSLALPSLVVVKNIWIERSYISVKGVTGAGFTLYYSNESAKAVYDSIAWCVSTGGGFGSAGGKNSVIAHNTINGTISFLMNLWYPGPPGNVNSGRDTLRGNVINVGTVTQGTKGFSVRGFVQNCLVDSNRVSQFFAVVNGGDLAGRYLYNSYYNTFRDNSWRFEADGNLPSPYVAFALRDSSHDNLFERDSMLCGVQSGYEIGGRLVNSGNANWTGQCINNHWKGCFFLTSSYTFNQDLLNNCLIENCVFASSHSYGLYILAPIKNTIIRNCTFASWAGAGLKLEGDPRGGGNQFSSNIFYTEQVGPCLSGKSVLFHGYSTGFTQNNNLFFSRTAQAGVTPANQSIYWASSSCSAPGPGTSWASATGNDVNSRYGDPKFASAAFQTFNPHLSAGSLAIGLGQGGVDAGAFPFGGGAADLTPPATVTNLTAAQINDNNLLLSWTAPGDDGTSGVAAAYDLRMSGSPITAANFASATSVGVQPIPGTPGALQTYAMMGLMPNTLYYFAIRTRDEMNNWSAVSNVVAPTTMASDTRAPANVNDLSTP